MADPERPDEISWTLQIQDKPGQPWHNHTSQLFWREDADALMTEHRKAYPKLRYRLVRVTTKYTVEREHAPSRKP